MKPRRPQSLNAKRTGNAFAAIAPAAMSFLYVAAAPAPGLAAQAQHLDRFIACDRFSEPPRRADCFESALQAYKDHEADKDAAVAPLSSRQSSAPPPEAAVASARPASPPVAEEPPVAEGKAPDIAGESRPAASQAGDGPESVAAKVASVRRDPVGRAIVTLENGDVWAQTDGPRIMVSKGDEITITQNFMGGSQMRTPGRSTFVRVRKVQ